MGIHWDSGTEHGTIFEGLAVNGAVLDNGKENGTTFWGFSGKWGCIGIMEKKMELLFEGLAANGAVLG